jgi:hypothetical protein
MVDDLEAAIDRLYQAPLATFTSARNALAAERRSAGDKDGADRVKALAKPSAVAWAVNQLYWQERERFDTLVAAVAEVAAAQREAVTGGGGGSLRDTMRRKSEVLAEVTRSAERKLVEGGSSGGLAVLQRLSATLEALASPRAKGTGPQAGRLSAELQPPGFDLALGLGGLDLPPPAPKPPRETAPAVPPVPSAADEAAREAEGRLQTAETEVQRSRRQLDKAVQSLGEAEARAAAARADVATLETRLLEARARVTKHTAAEDDARRELTTQRASLAEAERRLESLKRSPRG